MTKINGLILFANVVIIVIQWIAVLGVFANGGFYFRINFWLNLIPFYWFKYAFHAIVPEVKEFFKEAVYHYKNMKS